MDTDDRVVKAWGWGQELAGRSQWEKRGLSTIKIEKKKEIISEAKLFNKFLKFKKVF